MLRRHNDRWSSNGDQVEASQQGMQQVLETELHKHTVYCASSVCRKYICGGICTMQHWVTPQHDTFVQLIHLYAASGLSSMELMYVGMRYSNPFQHCIER